MERILGAMVEQQAYAPPDTQALLAQLVAAQTTMMVAQARAEERHARAEEWHAEMAAAQAEMQKALTALAHEQMQARAEAAKMQRRLLSVEDGLPDQSPSGSWTRSMTPQASGHGGPQSCVTPGAVTTRRGAENSSQQTGKGGAAFGQEASSTPIVGLSA